MKNHRKESPCFLCERIRITDGGKFEEAIAHRYDVRHLLINVVSYFQRTIIKRFIDPQFKVQSMGASLCSEKGFRYYPVASADDDHCISGLLKLYCCYLFN